MVYKGYSHKTQCEEEGAEDESLNADHANENDNIEDTDKLESLYEYNGESNYEEDDDEDSNLRESLAYSAMSLGMDNEDLLFNLLYFGDSGANIGQIVDSAVEETVSLLFLK